MLLGLGLNDRRVRVVIVLLVLHVLKYLLR